MNHPDDLRDDDHAELQALFDATAAEPEQPRLDRLARAAARIPGATARPWWRWLRLAIPATVAAALATAVWLGRDQAPSPGDPVPIAQTQTPSPSAPLAPIEDEASDEEMELALDYDEIDDEPYPLDDLDDPLAALDMGAALASPASLIDLLDPGDDEAALEVAADGFSALLEGG